MNKKKYPLLAALVCALFCFTVTQAQDKLWGLASYSFFSVNDNGTDYQQFNNFGSREFGEDPLRLQKLPTGEMLVIMEHGGVHDQGTICKITSAGVVKLYDFETYLTINDVAYSMAVSEDGYGYALDYGASAGTFVGIIRFKLDGSSYVRVGGANKEITRTDGLTAATHGIYGVSKGSSTWNGLIYKLRPDLSGVDIIYRFTDGKRPFAKLIEGRDGYLYGTTYLGGSYGYGTIFKISQDGSDFIKLHDFDQVNGSGPSRPLEQDAQGILYGSTSKGGKKAMGVLFTINEDGTNFQKVRDLADPNPNSQQFLLDDTGVFKPVPLGVSGDYLQWGTTSFVPDVYIDNPADQSSGLPVNLVLQAKPFPGATKYDIELSESPDFSSGLQKFTSEEPNANVTGLKHGTTYYTRVKPNIWSYYGKTTSFTTVDSINHASERLWGLNLHSIFSMNKDGSDFHMAFGGGASPYSYSGFLKLKNGEMLVVGDSTMSLDGTIFKITPSGVVKLYDIEEYTLSGHIARSMAEGNDGYVYALQYKLNSSAFWGIVRFKLDGSAFESYQFNQPNFLFTSALTTTTTEGVYGVNKGNTMNNGYIFKIKPDAKGIDIIYNFADRKPVGKLIQGRDGYLYGTTKVGGGFDVGTIYKVRTDGSDYQKLFDFDLINGRNPESGLVQDAAGVLYGIAPRGGVGGVGTLFRINEDGSDFRKLLDFSSVGGQNPNKEVTVDNVGNIYGAVSGVGVYKIRTDGTGFQVLKSFTHNELTSSLLLSEQILVPGVSVIEPQHQAVDVSVHPHVQINSYPWTFQYTLELSETADFSGDILMKKSNQPIIVLDSLKHTTVYYTRVKSDLLPYYGPVTWFTTRSSPGDTFIVSSAENAGGVPVNGLEIIVNYITGATKYTVQVSECDFCFSWNSIEKTGEQNTLMFDGLRHGTQYYVRAQTDLSVDWGPVSTFTAEYQLSAVTADVYPNPSSRTFTYKGSSSSNAITVTDMSGAVVYQNEQILPGESLKFGGNLKNGVYILRIQDADGVKTIRLLKVDD